MSPKMEIAVLKDARMVLTYKLQIEGMSETRILRCVNSLTVAIEGLEAEEEMRTGYETYMKEDIEMMKEQRLAKAREDILDTIETGVNFTPAKEEKAEEKPELELEGRWNDNPYRACVLDGIRAVHLDPKGAIRSIAEYDLPKTDKEMNFIIRDIKKTFPGEKLLKKRITNILNEK